MATQLTLDNLTILGGYATKFIDDGPSILRLTPNTLFSTGSAFSSENINLNNDFSASFIFRIKDNVRDGADGFTFSILANTGRTIGGDGGGLGYAGILESIGIEFDTYFNSENSDPDGNHIALDVNGEFGAPGTGNKGLPTFDSNKAVYAWIDYYANSGRIDVYVNTKDDKNRAVLGYRGNIDIDSVIGSTTGHVGFTASTGGSASIHDILSFQIRSFPSSDQNESLDNLTGSWQKKRIKLSSNKNAYAVILGSSSSRSVKDINIGSMYAKEERAANGTGANVALKKKRLSFAYGDFNKDNILDLKVNFRSRDLRSYVTLPEVSEMNIFGSYVDGSQFMMTTTSGSLPRIT